MKKCQCYKKIEKDQDKFSVQAIVFLNEGLENWEISKELEIHKSTVSRYVQLGKDKGTIKPLNS